MTTKSSSILLIDDNQEVLDGLTAHLQGQLADTVEVRTWFPSSVDDDRKPEEIFRSKVDQNTIMVATDYDLTGQGLTGLFGLTIVGWCQALAIPVGDFSRGHTAELPDEPNLFELRVPATDAEGAAFIASATEGFSTIRKGVQEHIEADGWTDKLPTILAELVDRKHLATQFALFMPRLGSSTSSLIHRLRGFADPENRATSEEKVAVLSYVLGHVLLNSILKYPGPLLSTQALGAYLSTTADHAAKLDELFKHALYDGPFRSDNCRYWREDVDELIDEIAVDLDRDDFLSFGDFNRAVLEKHTGGELETHSCIRAKCEGKKGGYLCPFTVRPVCERGDCSVPSTSWVPQGAQLSRVERDYYDEWAPLLGL